MRFPDCIECGSRSDLVSGREVYPRNRSLWKQSFYRCPECGAYVSCHAGTDEALGYPAGPETRTLRIRLHNVLDPIWKNSHTEFRFVKNPEGFQRQARRRCYEYLAFQLNLDVHNCHVSHFDGPTCQLAIRIISKVKTYSEIRDWWRLMNLKKKRKGRKKNGNRNRMDR